MGQKKLTARTRTARWAIAGRMLMADIHPDVCRMFDPDTLDDTCDHVTIVHAVLHATIFPPDLGQLVAHPSWKWDTVLRTCILHTMERFPDADPRSHLVGGYILMTMLAFWTPAQRVRVCDAIDYAVDMTRSDEVAGKFKVLRDTLLGAYDAALAMAAAGRSTIDLAADEEGAE